MGVIFKNIAAVTLASGTPMTELAAPTGSTTIVVSSIRLTNTEASDRKVTLKVQRPTGTPADLFLARGVAVPGIGAAQSGSSVPLPGELTLSPGYKLLGNADGTGVDCVVSGMERS